MEYDGKGHIRLDVSEYEAKSKLSVLSTVNLLLTGCITLDYSPKTSLILDFLT